MRPHPPSSSPAPLPRFAAGLATGVRRPLGWAQVHAGRALARPVGQRGEGVISTAIAVLVMAFLGAAMWLAFRDMFAAAADSTRTKVEEIGR